MKSVLITGAKGYIGSSLEAGLKDKFEVTTLDRDILELSDSNAVQNYFEDKYFDVVLHCAAVGGSRLKKDTPKVLDNNLSAYYNLVNNCNSFGKFINFGSGAEFIARDTYYGLSKHVINSSILGRSLFYNVRIFAVFDENEVDTRFIKTNIKKYLNKEPLTIFSNKMMDFFYMEDLVRLVQYYITEDKLPKEFDCSYRSAPTLLDLAQIINQLDAHIVNVSCEAQQQEDYCGTYRELPVDFLGLEEGIARTYAKLKKRHYNNI